MQYENFKSDFKLEVTLMLGGAAIAVPAHDFELVFSSGDGPERYVCGRCGGEWLRCSPTADNSKLMCYLDDHRLGPGVLKCLFVDHAPDGEMPDGEMRKVVPQELDVELVVDAGEDAVEVDADVVVSVETLLGDVRALADELETKKATNYWKGAPGSPGTPGVGITSVVQTTTSHVSEGENIVTVTLSNGQQSTFSVFNGKAGSGGGGDLDDYYTKTETDRLVGAKYTLPTGGVPATDLASAVQTSLGKADTALQSQVQSDWNESSTSSAAYIANKPSIPAAQVNADWNAESGVAQILNKPSIPNLATYIPIIEDARTGSDVAITGTAPFASLADGQRIVLHFKYRNEASPTLQLTLSGGDTTLAYPLYQNYNSGVGALTVQAMPAGSYGEFVYDATNSRWMLIGKDVNTTYSYTSQTDINNSAQGSRLIEPALLRSNFYLKSEAQAKRTLVDDTDTSGTVTLSVNGYHDLGERSAVAVDLPSTYTRTDEFLFTFECSSSWNNGTITLPQGVKLADGFDWSEAAEGVVFQVSIQDGVCAYLVVSPTNP